MSLLLLFNSPPSGTAYNASASESFTITESVARTTAKRVSDALALTESAFRAIGRAYTDSIGFSDSLVRALARNVAETLGLSDSATRQPQKRASDVLQLTETTSIRSIARQCADALGLQDSLAKTLAREFDDMLLLVDWGQAVKCWVIGAKDAVRKFWAEVRNRLFSAELRVRLFSAESHQRRFVALKDTMIYIPDPKDPESIENFQVDWSTAIGLDTIASSAWELPSDLTSVAEAFTTTTTTIRISGGVSGSTYVIKNLVTLASDEKLAQPLLLPVL